jgi:hypothetical protein
MSIIKYRPMGMSKTFDDFFENFFNQGLGEMMGADNFLSAPSVNIRDEADQYILGFRDVGPQADLGDVLPQAAG